MRKSWSAIALGLVLGPCLAFAQPATEGAEAQGQLRLPPMSPSQSTPRIDIPRIKTPEEQALDRTRAGTGRYFRYDRANDVIEIRETEGGPVATYSPAEFEARVRTHFADETTLTYSKIHGWQAEYTSADGKAYLWYPGNKVILHGSWRVSAMSVCFRYEEESYNPATGRRGNQEECQPGTVAVFEKSEQRPGDAFHLSAGLPYVRGHEDKPAWPGS
jgi:hypothetical protein